MGLGQSQDYHSVRTVSDSDDSGGVPVVPQKRWQSNPFRLQMVVLLLAVLYAIVFFQSSKSFGNKVTDMDFTPPTPIVERAIVQSCTVKGGTASGCHNQFHCMLNNWDMLEKYGSKTPVIYMIDKKEAFQKVMCEEAAKKHSFPVHCVVLKDEMFAGWGFPKISAVLNAPGRNLLWFDCDVMVTGPVDHLFDNEDFQQTGSVWWASPARNFPNPFRGNYRGAYRGSDPKTIEWEKWVDVSKWEPHQIELGFDSGSFMLNIEKTKIAMDFLLAGIQNKTMRAFLEDWSMGDKDTWHISLLMTDTNFTVMPWMGKLGSEGWYGSRFGHDFEGNPLYFHGNLGANNVTILVDIRKPEMLKCVLEKIPQAETCPISATLPGVFEKYQTMIEMWNSFNQTAMTEWINRANNTIEVVA